MPGNISLSAAKAHLTKNWVYYSIALIVSFILKYCYSKAGSDELVWILAPTAWWVNLLSGIRFEWVQNIGFMNHAYRFIIAPSCSGMNFMIIVFATLLFSYLYRMEKRLLWIAASLGLAYLLTILVNGFRIVVSIYLLKLDIYGGWLTYERVHMLEGTIIYFASLIVIYRLAGGLLKCRLRGGFIPPLACYLTVTLGIPLLNRAPLKGGTGFAEHVVLMLAVCFVIVLLSYLASFLFKAAENSKGG